MTPEIAILCLKIFCCRIMDVSLGTMRTIQIVKGKRLVAACFGLCEVFIWFMVVRSALRSDMGGIPIALAYSAGYATGTLMGCFISDKFISHKMCVQVVTSGRDPDMIHTIRAGGFGVSVVEVQPSEFTPGGKFLLLIEIDGRQLKALKKLITSLDEKAFITISESKTVYNGYFAK